MPASGRIAPPPDRLQSWPRGFGSHGLPSAAWPWRSLNTGCRRPAAARKAATHRSQRSVGVEASSALSLELAACRSGDETEDDRDDERQQAEKPGSRAADQQTALRSEEHTSELQSLMRISYAVFCMKKKKYKIRS